MPISAEDNVSTADLEYFATRTNNHPVVFCEKGVQASGSDTVVFLGILRNF